VTARAPHITVQIVDPVSPEVVTLIERLDEFLTGLYPAESNHLLSVASLRQPKVTFLIASVDGKAVGCGALVKQNGAYAELKRIFVVPEFRGLKIGNRLLHELESLARAAGLQVVRLETGISQLEALRLFENAGYQRRGPFGSYPEDPWSVFMEKKLALP
jgi:putative acetyltransferase